MPLREHLEFAAKRGVPRAIDSLDGPECPESLRYLLRWARELHGRSGVAMTGFAPLSWTTIRHWRKERGLRRLAPFEVEALLGLDAVMCFPGEAED